MKPLILGYGRSGHRLHYPCLLKAAERQTDIISKDIAVIEHREIEAPPCGVPVFREFARVTDFDPANTVVHICNEPRGHEPALQAAVAMGYRQFILEKPVAESTGDVVRIASLAREHALKVVVNLPWQATGLTAALRNIVVSGRYGRLQRLTMVQTKTRQPRPGEADELASFGVELPHEAALALYLTGRPGKIAGVSSKPFVSAGRLVPFMGGASMTLDHGGIVSDLQSDLDCPVKERRIDLFFENGWHMRGFYPVDGTDGTQRAHFFDEKGELRSQVKYSNDPMTDLFVEAYRYFGGVGPEPSATLSLGVESALLTCEAKSICRPLASGDANGDEEHRKQLEGAAA